LAVTELLPLIAARDARADEATAALRLRADADPVGAFAFLAIAPDPLLLAFFRAAMAQNSKRKLDRPGNSRIAGAISLLVNAVCPRNWDMGAQIVKREVRKPLQLFLYHNFGEQSKTSRRQS
jgi:hypothetical protein